MTQGELRALAEAVAREAGALLRDAFRGPDLRITRQEHADRPRLARPTTTPST